MPNQLVTQKQASFAGGLSAVANPQSLGPDEVQTSTNLDYSVEWGAAAARRGCVRYATTTASGTSSVSVALVVRNYGLSTGVWSDQSIPWYAAGLDGKCYSGSGTSLPVALSSIAGYSGGAQTGILPAWTQYQGYVYLANGTSAFKTNGTATYDWLLPQAPTPSVTQVIQQGTGLAGPFPGFQSGLTAAEGTVVSTSTTTAFQWPVVLYTCTNGTGSRIVLTATTGTQTNWEYPTVFVVPPTGTAVSTGTSVLGTLTYTVGGQTVFYAGYPDGDTTGTFTATATITKTLTLGNLASDFTMLGLSDQQSIVSIQRDLSVGDATFTNYWHTETTPSAITDVTPDPVVLMLDAQGLSSSEDQAQALNRSRAFLPQPGRKPGYGTHPVRRSVSKTATAVTPSPWGVARSDYQFVGILSNPDFTNIQAVRIIIEYNVAGGKTAVVGGVMTYGGDAYHLTDQVTGISYYQTFARVENGFIVAEGAPSDPTAPIKLQYSNVTLAVAPSTNSTAGITHRVFYRAGGLLQDAYRLGSVAISTGTGTTSIFDIAMPDMTIINNPALERNLWTAWPSPSAGTGLPGVNAVSLPWQERVWVGVQNQLFWSVPGQFGKIQDDSQTTVADLGDNIAAIIPGQNLTILNQASVFELSGSIFEGTNANWTLTRTGARRGSSAPRTCINTPHGILLLGYDGLSFYRQGFGVDQDISWVYERIGDLWKGTAATDPAQIKGRIPALNPLAIFNSCAAYKDEKIYLAVPTGSSTLANTMFVLDVTHQKIWMFSYPFSICSLFWDRVGNRLMAGTSLGTVQQLEVGLTDATEVGNSAGIGWSFRTREWSNPIDQIMENIQSELAGTMTVIGLLDSTNTITAGTSTSSSRAWQPVPLSGSVGNDLVLGFSGTQSGTQQILTGLSWDSIPQTPKVTYFETDPQALPSENYVKTWLADLNVLGGTCTASILIDGTVILSTALTLTDSTVTGRRVFEIGLPNVTDGKNVVARYSGGPFRHYGTDYEFEPKPFNKSTWIVTYKKAGGVTQADMARFFAMDIEGSSTSTVTSTWIIDGAVFSTNTLIFGATDTGEEAGEGIVRNYMDQIPFPPGARGYLFQQEITSGTNSLTTNTTTSTTTNTTTTTSTGTATASFTVISTAGVGRAFSYSGTSTASDPVGWPDPSFVDTGTGWVVTSAGGGFTFSPAASISFFSGGAASVWPNTSLFRIPFTVASEVSTVGTITFVSDDRLTEVWLNGSQVWAGTAGSFHTVTTQTLTASGIVIGTSGNILGLKLWDLVPSASNIAFVVDGQSLELTTNTTITTNTTTTTTTSTVTDPVPFKVWRSSLDIERIGVKGLSRVTLNGTPSQS